jgi:hypothetical protein
MCCAGFVQKFNESAWGRKLRSRVHKASLTDFDRYLATKARMAKAKKVREYLAA